ncbi:MAG TPA: prepilin-type N-terminal cleavage/methylation domain-containing protein [Gemmatimonadaceae bacterium]|nr:prepilin-type N-terminal cleavage/methylation domain-containing protein [Gemmatimonadaceae bacterium]
MTTVVSTIAQGNIDQSGSTHAHAKRKRSGFILMEVIVAMTLLALIMTPLAGMVFKITTRSHRTVGNTYLNGVLMHQVNYLQAVPYDSLAEGTRTTVIADPPYPHTQTVTVQQYYSRWQLRAKKVTLIITPTNTLYRPDTSKFIRSSANTRTTFISDGL